MPVIPTLSTQKLNRKIKLSLGQDYVSKQTSRKVEEFTQMMVVKTPSLTSENSGGKLENNIDSALSCGRGDKGGVRPSPFVTVLAFGKEKPSQGKVWLGLQRRLGDYRWALLQRTRVSFPAPR